jgi:hypothetical protein
VAYIPNPLIIPIGFIMGVLLAMPLGPVNLLGIQRAVQRGFFGGMAAGIGIMLGDGLIALGAALRRRRCVIMCGRSPRRSFSPSPTRVPCSG